MHLTRGYDADTIPQVRTHHVCLEDGVATLKTVEDCNVVDIVQRIEAAGFPAKMMSSKPITSPKPSANESCSTKKSDGDVKELAWAQRNSTAIAAGLLSSSCCLLQLVLNVLAMLNVVHIGCAGFNKVLGPWRTEMRT